jgi:ankyrin repeat protein
MRQDHSFAFFSQYTPLHLSAFGGHLEITRLLLQCNADIEAKDFM